jgi:hypothetical protein
MGGLRARSNWLTYMVALDLGHKLRLVDGEHDETSRAYCRVVMQRW